MLSDISSKTQEESWIQEQEVEENAVINVPFGRGHTEKKMPLCHL